MGEHELKTHPGPFQAVLDGRKRFEFRRDDRAFLLGDVLALREWEPGSEEYTGRRVRVRVTYMLREKYGIPDGFCVMGIEPLPVAVLDCAGCGARWYVWADGTWKLESGYAAAKGCCAEVGESHAGPRPLVTERVR